MSGKITKEILKNLESLDILSDMSVNLIRIINNPDSTINEITSIVETDPILVSRLLRLVNSSYISGINSKKIESVKDSIIRVGFNEVRTIITAYNTKDLIRKFSICSSDFDIKRIWYHSVNVAILSRIIMKKLYNKDGEKAFLAGILHDIGIPLICVSFPDKAKRLLSNSELGYDIIGIENKELDTNHAEISYHILQIFNVDDEICEAILHHHECSKGKKIQCVLRLADFISNKKGLSPFIVNDTTKIKLEPHLIKLVKSNYELFKNLDYELDLEMNKLRELFIF